ncbi:hypothetical protein FGO68_gene7456 [Halteria grandinella]|uniref:Uncharacterized protein n=1 Tax=Halteria grandinella TaxID=5974 RepID=A0A8J8T413_HALGN|nr:hypothetical protein FGO68_gene7456 [Halteria grandinella]
MDERIIIEAMEQNIIVIRYGMDENSLQQLWKWYKLRPPKPTKADIEIEYYQGNSFFSSYLGNVQMTFDFEGKDFRLTKEQGISILHLISRSQQNWIDLSDQIRLNMRSTNIVFKGHYCNSLIIEAIIVRYPNLENFTLSLNNAVFDVELITTVPDIKSNTLKSISIRVETRGIETQKNVAKAISNLISKCVHLESVVIEQINNSPQDENAFLFRRCLVEQFEELRLNLPKLQLKIIANTIQFLPYSLDPVFNPHFNIKHFTLSVSNSEICDFPEVIQHLQRGRFINSNLEKLELELYGRDPSTPYQVALLKMLHARMGKRQHLVISLNTTFSPEMYKEVLKLEPQLRVICNIDTINLEPEFLRQTVEIIKEKRKRIL